MTVTAHRAPPAHTQRLPVQKPPRTPPSPLPNVFTTITVALAGSASSAVCVWLALTSLDPFLITAATLGYLGPAVLSASIMNGRGKWLGAAVLPVLVLLFIAPPLAMVLIAYTYGYLRDRTTSPIRHRWVTAPLLALAAAVLAPACVASASTRAHDFLYAVTDPHGQHSAAYLTVLAVGAVLGVASPSIAVWAAAPRRMRWQAAVVVASVCAALSVMYALPWRPETL